ncbi:MAG: hypothetical protein NDI61_13510 [Bdellovibrionaceae bacterium]|nr:hypothetical protein [Pseudobdellovibrionaceae bacterium]
MKRALSLLMMAFVLAGCEDFSGQMNVTAPFAALAKSGRFSQPRSITIPAGAYSVNVDTKLSGDVDLSLKVNGKSETIRVQIPKDRVPKENGVFTVSAAESGQPFDLRGELETTYERSHLYRGWDSCTRTVPQQVCGYDRDGRYYCRVEYVTVWGQQQVEYYLLTTSRALAIELTKAQTSLADIEGHNSSTHKVYTYQGYCF